MTEDFIQVSPAFLRSLTEHVGESFEKLIVLRLALDEGSTWKEGLPHDVVAGMAKIVFRIEETLGLAFMDTKGLLKAVEEGNILAERAKEVPHG